jgi:hypothetical protein
MLADDKGAIRFLSCGLVEKVVTERPIVAGSQNTPNKSHLNSPTAPFKHDSQPALKVAFIPKIID